MVYTSSYQPFKFKVTHKESGEGNYFVSTGGVGLLPMIEFIPIPYIPGLTHGNHVKEAHWFWSTKWQEREKLADDDIRVGRLSKPISDETDLGQYLSGL